MIIFYKNIVSTKKKIVRVFPPYLIYLVFLSCVSVGYAFSVSYFWIRMTERQVTIFYLQFVHCNFSALFTCNSFSGIILMRISTPWTNKTFFTSPNETFQLKIQVGMMRLEWLKFESNIGVVWKVRNQNDSGKFSGVLEQNYQFRSRLFETSTFEFQNFQKFWACSPK